MWILLLGALAFGSPDGIDPLLASELQDALVRFEQAGEPAHYVAIELVTTDAHVLSAADGALAKRRSARERSLDVDVRLGDPQLDTTRQLRGVSSMDADYRAEVGVAWSGPDVLGSLRRAVRRELDARYRDAEERIVLLRSERTVRTEEEHPAPDFSPAPARVAEVSAPQLAFDPAPWEQVILAASRTLSAPSGVTQAVVTLTVDRTDTVFVDSEGSRVRHARTDARVRLGIGGVADDGDRLSLMRDLYVHDPAELPDAERIERESAELAEALSLLLASPRARPYTGPILLSGRAAAVFTHEVIGHRVEGHRNKRDFEGKTFLEQVGRSVMPPWLHLYDDPRLHHTQGQDLAGHYAFDNEGMPADRATIVEGGIFRGFLMSRSPLADFPDSNGHGRRSPGHEPVARMGVTVLEATKTLAEADLRRGLLQEAKRQGLDHAYIIDDIGGGFTMTGRIMPNAFNVRALTARRAYVDGRPDELVRGIDLVGTPLAALRNIVAAGDTPEVFNGVCGAESGWVPVSAVAPALLFQRLELQLKEKGTVRPPLLPRPDAPPGGEG